MPMMVLRRLDILPEPTTPVQKGKVKMAKVKGELERSTEGLLGEILGR